MFLEMKFCTYTTVSSTVSRNRLFKQSVVNNPLQTTVADDSSTDFFMWCTRKKIKRGQRRLLLEREETADGAYIGHKLLKPINFSSLPAYSTFGLMP
jgi:hypothetical protein